MKLHHAIEVGGAPDVVYRLVGDLSGLARCVPGAGEIDGDGDRCTGRVRIKAGPVTANYAGTAAVVERDDRQRYLVFEARADAGGAGGKLQVTFGVRVGESETGGPGASLISVDTDLNLRGVAAQLGRGPIEAVADQLVRGLVANVQREIDRPTTGAGDQPAPAAAAAGPRTVPPAVDGADERNELSALALVGPSARAALRSPGTVGVLGVVLGLLGGLLLGRLRRGPARGLLRAGLEPGAGYLVVLCRPEQP